MNLRPFFTYFGAKYRAAPHYPAPRHDTIIEPFAGAAGYALRYYQRNVILTDLSEHIVGTWDYLINATPDEIRRLPLYDGTWETVGDLNVPQEAKWLIGWWLNKGGASPRKQPSTWMRTGVRPNSHWGEAVRDRIASQVERISHWQVRLASYEETVNRPATWFVDPPYQVAGREYKHNSIDYEHLADWCKARQGQVIACENEGADWLPFRFLRDIRAMSGPHRSGFSSEAIWTNDTSGEVAA